MPHIRTQVFYNTQSCADSLAEADREAVVCVCMCAPERRGFQLAKSIYVCNACHAVNYGLSKCMKARIRHITSYLSKNQDRLIHHKNI